MSWNEVPGGEFFGQFVGRVRSPLQDPDEAPPQGSADTPEAVVEVFSAYADAARELAPGAEAVVLTWLHLAERERLRVHPFGKAEHPERGVFSTRSPHRPNPVGLHRVRVLGREEGEYGVRLLVHPLEAVDGTPVIDIKSIIGAEPAPPRLTGDVDHAAAAELVRAGREAWRRGLVSGFNGNLSLRLGRRVAITGTGCAKGRLGPANVAVLDLESGRRIAGCAASSESGMHRAVYRMQPLAKAVVHTHPPSLLALSLLTDGATGPELLDLPLYEAAAFAGELAVVPALEPGTRELARAVGEAARERRAVLLSHHGLMAWGEDLDQALGLTEELESLARIRLATLAHVRGGRGA